VSRRRRALLFALAAGFCAALAARSVSGYSQGVEAQLGPLRAALVAGAPLPAKRVLRGADRRRLEVRRVPERFVPPGALTDPAEAIGRAPTAVIPAGAYVLGAQLEVPGSRHAHHRSPLSEGRTPVEIPVTGAAALSPRVGGSARRLVDVVVTAEPHGDSGEGRTYVAAGRVRLLELRAADPNSGDVAPALPDASIATLALTHAQALSLIHAQNFAREVRLVASGG
jgi:Flp pilus assembly protein CpaB